MKNEWTVRVEIGNISVKAIIDFWQYENKVDFSMHEHNSFEIHTIMSGSAELETDNGVVILQECDSVLISPGVFHRFTNQSNGSVVFSFVFYIDKIGESAKSLSERIICEKMPVLFMQNKEIKENLSKIISCKYNGTAFSEDSVKAHLMLVFVEIFSAFINEKVVKTESLLSDEDVMRTLMIEEYFNEFYMERISLQKLSKLLHLSEKQTERIIKKAFGTGFRQKLSKLRIMNAKKLLTDSELEVREIAEACGYSSYNGFYLAFKEKTGMTPIEYRKKISNQ